MNCYIVVLFVIKLNIFPFIWLRLLNSYSLWLNH